MDWQRLTSRWLWLPWFIAFYRRLNLALVVIMRYFKYSEFDCKDPDISGVGTGEKFMVMDFLERIDELRHRCGFPFVITSGYRTPEYNMKVSNSGAKGPHTTGKAADIEAKIGREKYIILKHAMTLGFTGIGIARTYIHLDTLGGAESSQSRPWVWTY